MPPVWFEADEETQFLDYMMYELPSTSDKRLNDLVQATPVFAILLVLSQVPGAPDQGRSALNP
jgi:hypothetical protein